MWASCSQFPQVLGFENNDHCTASNLSPGAAVEVEPISIPIICPFGSLLGEVPVTPKMTFENLRCLIIQSNNESFTFYSLSSIIKETCRHKGQDYGGQWGFVICGAKVRGGCPFAALPQNDWVDGAGNIQIYWCDPTTISPP